METVEAYVNTFYSNQNAGFMQRAVSKAIGRDISFETIMDGMQQAYHFFDRPVQTGTAAMLDPDFGKASDDVAAQSRKLEKLNAEAYRFIVDKVDTEMRAESLYNYELSVPLGDRMPQYPGMSQVHKSLAGTVRLLDETQTPEIVALSKALARDPAALNYLNVTDSLPELQKAGWEA